MGKKLYPLEIKCGEFGEKGCEFESGFQNNGELTKNVSTTLDLNANSNHLPANDAPCIQDTRNCGKPKSSEKDPMAIWKQMKQNGFLSSSHGGVVVPSMPKPRARKKGNELVVKKKMEIAKREQVDRFAKVAAPSGLLNDLNPGIINHVRNRKQVHAIIENLVRSSRNKNRNSEHKQDDGILNHSSGSQPTSFCWSADNGSGLTDREAHFRSKPSHHGSLPIKQREDDALALKLSSASIMRSENMSSLTNEESANISTVDSLSVKVTVEGKAIPNPDLLTWTEEDQRAVILQSSLTEEAAAEVLGLTTAHQIWLSLEAAYSNASVERIHSLRDSLRQLKKGTSSVSDYCRRFKALCDQLSAIGHPVVEIDKLHWFLCGLGPSYETLSSAIRATKPAPMFRDLVTQAESHELFLQSLHGTPTPPAAFHVETTNNNSAQGQGRSYSNRGNHSRGRGRGHNRPYSSPSSDESLAKAFHAQCHVTTNTPDWHVDSGATDHMTPACDSLHHSSPYPGSAKVMFGNGKTLPITHTGSTTVSHDIPLRNVLVIPKLKKLLSVSKLTTDHPVDVLFSQPFYIHDRKTKRVLARGRCEHGLYVLKDEPTAFIAAAKVIKPASYELWHACLGHVSFDSLHGTPTPPAAFHVETTNNNSAQGQGRSYSNRGNHSRGRGRGHNRPYSSPSSDESLAKAFHAQCHVTTNTPDWHVDSGATDHMTPACDSLHHSSPYPGSAKVMFGNGKTLPITHTGSTTVSHDIPLRNVLVIPKLKKLLSVSKLTTDHPVDVLFSQPFYIHDRKTKRVLARGRCEHGLYVFKDEPTAFIAAAKVIKPASYELWHACLGHVSFDVISTLNKLGVLSITSLLPKPILCTPCQLAKGQRLPFTINAKRSSHPSSFGLDSL
nr:putative zinc finger, CCHC-type [Tanacetum cinerariifolium]